MSKHIWIINEYAGSPIHGMEFRHYYLAKEFVKAGDRVTIVSSAYSHLFKTRPSDRRETIDGIDYLWLKTLDYGTAHNKKRALKWIIFTIRLFFLPWTLPRPDIIIVSPMAPFPILPAWILSKIYRTKLIFEVKDIWPLSLIEIGGYRATHPFIKLMGWFERFALRRADTVVSNLQNYGAHMRALGVDRNFVWISNGVDLGELSEIESLDPNVVRKIPENRFIVGYTGTVGVANALDSFLDCAAQLKKYPEILLLVVGEGQEKAVLKQRYDQYENILFLDAIPKRAVQSMLRHFDACYIGLQKEALFKYGVSPNKLFDYMYSAKPVLYAIESGKNIVDMAGCGISVKAQNSDAIRQGILKLYNMSEDERETLGKLGHRYVLEQFTYEKLAAVYQEQF